MTETAVFATGGQILAIVSAALMVIPVRRAAFGLCSA